MNERQRHIIEHATEHLRSVLENYDWEAFRTAWETQERATIERYELSTARRWLIHVLQKRIRKD